MLVIADLIRNPVPPDFMDTLTFMTGPCCKPLPTDHVPSLATP